jgi:hypothetical protein
LRITTLIRAQPKMAFGFIRLYPDRRLTRRDSVTKNREDIVEAFVAETEKLIAEGGSAAPSSMPQLVNIK